jgi:Ala-tRNA(Pro) deacylase
MSLDDFLNQRHVAYERLQHPPVFTASRIARILHIPGKEVAKTVLVRVDQDYVLVVLPATHHVDLERVRQQLGAQHVELAREQEMAQLFPDCETGAIPPFGSLYHLTTLVDESLTDDEEIVFEAQNHHEAIRLAYRDFVEQEHPCIGHFTTSYLQELVERYSKRLLLHIRKQLPERLRQRVDPEDVVQSVYRSLFRRLKSEPHAFDDSQRVWRLLTTLAYHKVRALVKYHQRARRDVRREQPAAVTARSFSDREPGPAQQASFDDLLDHFLKELPQEQRSIVALRLQGDGIDDIARHVDRTASEVRRILSEVQDGIRREMEARD